MSLTTHDTTHRCATILARDLIARGMGAGSVLKFLFRAYGGTLSNHELYAIVGAALWSQPISKGA